ncbi:hypothetical protein T439DRAFT_351150 [Meredithblackwellia eburnea MCA 4105]
MSDPRGPPPGPPPLKTGLPNPTITRQPGMASSAPGVPVVPPPPHSHHQDHPRPPHTLPSHHPLQKPSSSSSSSQPPPRNIVGDADGWGEDAAPALTPARSMSAAAAGEPVAPISVVGSSSSRVNATSTTTTSNGKRQKTSDEDEERDDVPELGSSGAPGVGGARRNSTGVKDKEKEKKTRNRKPSSCVQCRRKKLRCNRAAPCDQCTSRGVGAHCAWDDATPLFDARAEHDAQELRDQVARLESLVRYLTAQPGADASGSGPGSGGDSSSFSGSPGTHEYGSGGSGSVMSPGADYVRFPENPPDLRKNEAPPYAMDLRPNDLCEALAQMCIKEFVVLEGSGNEAWAPGGGRGEVFLEEARVFMDTLPQRFGLTGNMPSFDGLGEPGWGSTAAISGPGSIYGPTTPTSSEMSPSALGSAAFHRAAPPLSDALKYLPTDAQAHSAYGYFCGYVSWYSHPVHLPTFEMQWSELREALKLENPAERDKAVDPFFISTYLGVLAMGLAMMPAKRAIRDGFPADKDKLVDYWLEGAMVALTCGRFLDNPSVESVRAVVAISTFFVFLAKGESSGAGMGLLSLAVQVAHSLGLHRDPDRTPSKFTFFEAEERRRLFWSLFMLCILSSASLGRTWAVFDLNGVDTKLPLDCHDEEIMDEFSAKAGIERRKRKSEETAMTSLLCKMKLAVMAKKINDAAFGIKPVTYRTILELDRNLKEFEETIPAKYQLRLDSVGALVRPTTHVTVTEMRACMIQISLCSEFIRVHRPWLVMASTDPTYQYSRDQAITYSKLMLAIFRSPSCASSSYGGLVFKATSAAVVLGVEILTFPDGSEVDALRAYVRAAALQMEKHIETSSLCRKGARILRFLLEKDAVLVAQREQERASKRRRFQGSSASGTRLRTAFDPDRTSTPPAVPTGSEENQARPSPPSASQSQYRPPPPHRQTSNQSTTSPGSGGSPSSPYDYPAYSPPVSGYGQPYQPSPPQQPAAAPHSLPSGLPYAPMPMSRLPQPAPVPVQPEVDPLLAQLGFGPLSGDFDFNFYLPMGGVGGLGSLGSYPQSDSPTNYYDYNVSETGAAGGSGSSSPALPPVVFPPTPASYNNSPDTYTSPPGASTISAPTQHVGATPGLASGTSYPAVSAPGGGNPYSSFQFY